LRLFNGKLQKWEVVVVDDFVPTKGGKPIFTKSKGAEMWVLLLEKAFAKLVGDYEKLEGGMPIWALEVGRSGSY
jgi:calpain-15